MADSNSFRCNQNIKNAFLNFKKSISFSKALQEKYSRMLSIFDQNGDNKIDARELQNIWNAVEKFAGSDKTLSVSEADDCVMDAAKGLDWWGAAFTSKNTTSKELFEFLNVLTNTVMPNRNIKSIYQKLNLQSQGLSFKVFETAMKGYNKLPQKEKTNNMLGIFDTSQGEDKERYYLIDLKNMKVVARSVMYTGKNKKGLKNIKMANKLNSHSTLSGFERVGTEKGEYSYYSVGMRKQALKLEGLELGINETAYRRGTVIHYSKGDTLGCKGFPPVLKRNGKVDIEATNRRMYQLFPKGTILYTHSLDSNYEKYSKLVD